MENVPEIITNLLPEKISVADIFKPGFIDPTLKKIKAINDEFLKTASVETATGRKEIASHARKNASSKVWLDDMGKSLVEDSKKVIKLVDTERKKIRDFFDSERDRTRKPLTDFEAAEAEKEELRRKEAVYLMDWDEALAMDDLFNREREIKRKEAEFARIEAEAKAKAEVERIERERIAREEQIRKEAEDKAKRDAEAKKLADDRAKFEAEQAAARAEADKKAKEEAARIKAANEKLVADREAIRKQEAEIEARKKADIERKYYSDWTDAIEINRIMIPDLAVKMNQKFDEARKERLMANAERAKLISADIEKLNQAHDHVFLCWSKMVPLKKFDTQEGEAAFNHFKNSLGDLLSHFQTVIAGLA